MRVFVRILCSCVVTLAGWGVASSPVVSTVQGSSELKDHPNVIKYAAEPVNARVDRVWHAIPGLCGWRIDEAASQDATNHFRDGKIHLVWQPSEPNVRLRELPAQPIYRGPKEEKSICLMFNVSWGEQYVPSILKTLKRESVHATFFLDGDWLKHFPDIAKQIRSEGHTIGSHGTGHPDFSKLTNAQLTHQVVGTRKSIQHTLGVTSDLIAPPSGAYDQRTVNIARQNHMYTVLWTVDTVDWRRPPASQIVSRVLQGVEPGALVLMHPTEPTAEGLPTMIRSLRAKGYSFKTVEQLVKEERVVKPPTLLE